MDHDRHFHCNTMRRIIETIRDTEPETKSFYYIHTSEEKISKIKDLCKSFATIIASHHTPPNIKETSHTWQLEIIPKF